MATSPEDIIRKIKNLEFPQLNIGKNLGLTGYLDFFEYDDLQSNKIMKGCDSANRPFYVFNAEIKYQDITLKKTLTSFFQRYSDCTTLWHCCGKYPDYLMDTTGGVNIHQLEMLYNLFLTGKVKIDLENIENIENLKLLDNIEKIKLNKNFNKSENFITISLIE
jgi:hypothetical protein